MPQIGTHFRKRGSFENAWDDNLLNACKRSPKPNPERCDFPKSAPGKKYLFHKALSIESWLKFFRSRFTIYLGLKLNTTACSGS
jgi:tRNA U34 5-methylaminomethyl-2-thiouridine-forming methyltransferase MnmC